MTHGLRPLTDQTRINTMVVLISDYYRYNMKAGYISIVRVSANNLRDHGTKSRSFVNKNAIAYMQIVGSALGGRKVEAAKIRNWKYQPKTIMCL